MIRGTTPTNRIRVNADLRGATVFVTYEQNGRNVLEKTGGDVTVEEDLLTVTLSQEDTLALHEGPVRIQVRYVTMEDKAGACKVMNATVERILKDGVIVFTP